MEDRSAQILAGQKLLQKLAKKKKVSEPAKTQGSDTILLGGQAEEKKTPTTTILPAIDAAHSSATEVPSNVNIDERLISEHLNTVVAKDQILTGSCKPSRLSFRVIITCIITNYFIVLIDTSVPCCDSTPQSLIIFRLFNLV
jgi:hypothetical protein